MDWDFIMEHRQLYTEAAQLTVRIAAAGICGALILGLICGVIRYYKVPVLHRVTGIYIELSRNTPLVVQLFFLYFGLPRAGIVLQSEICAAAGLIFLGGGYIAETFRSGLESVEKVQTESGLSLGFRRIQIFFYILLPQAAAAAVPGIGANVIFLLKETSVFSIVALADLMYVAKDLIGLYYKTDEALFLLVVCYLMILLPVSILFTLLERRLRYAGYGN
ncbi:MAG TPA: amino acid ABC transporter permease [Candidatus Anaerostipes avistercoris]|uniref:Amino acid ABC transporter permease n=1 Tax=Candidatus Anaerostipes avistercoris TaxID=2838462 RepID=A0A9D2T9W7_9FIRM|nr:amino acid ABC transporter permease [Candidatus Anaerostipes avistercoris]